MRAVMTAATEAEPRTTTADTSSRLPRLPRTRLPLLPVTACAVSATLHETTKVTSAATMLSVCIWCYAGMQVQTECCPKDQLTTLVPQTPRSCLAQVDGHLLNEKRQPTRALVDG
jgi:hypothetical protein